MKKNHKILNEIKGLGGYPVGIQDKRITYVKWWYWFTSCRLFILKTWCDTSKVYDTGEYTGSQSSSASTYNDFKQYSIPAPFAAGEVYQLDVDVKGSGLLYNYFYGAANYLQVASWTNSNGQSGTGTDGFNQIPLTSSYTHYTVRFTLSNNGNTGVVKYLLFRAMPGCTATIKNISFKKVSSSSTAYVNGQSVKNLTSTNGATVNLYAIWNANTYTISLNANGGSDGTTSVNIAYNTAQGNYPSITKPTRTGYTFNGFWDTNAASGGTQWYELLLSYNGVIIEHLVLIQKINLHGSI